MARRAGGWANRLSPLFRYRYSTVLAHTGEMEITKARENQARRAAQRQGLRLTKARVRDPLARDFGWHITRGRRRLAHFRDFADAEAWIADPNLRSSSNERG